MADRYALFDVVLDAMKALAERVTARLDAIERREVPAGRDGRDGAVGPQGPPGERGLQGDKGLDGSTGVDGQPGKDGANGLDGQNGFDGLNGKDGAPGERGDKGLDGRDGLNGKDGMDGFGFDDLSVTYDGERQFVWTFTKGDRSKVFTFDVPAVIYKGVFNPTTHYSTGDQVTYAASQWIARGPSVGVNPDEHIPESKRLWTLSSKRGERGRTGEKGADGKIGPRGDKGDRGPDRW